MWNKAEGPRGFDTDATLPYRERLVVIYLHTDKQKVVTSGVGEAYVHDGEWYWWDSTNTTCVVKVQPTYRIVLWTPLPGIL